MSASGIAGSGEPDMVLVGELLEEIQRRPPAIAASKLLAEHYISCGWLDAAKDIIKELKRHAPRDSEVTNLAAIVEKKPEPPAPETSQRDLRTSKPGSTSTPAAKPVRKKVTHPPPQLNGNLDSARKDLTEGYSSLRSKAKFLLTDLLHLQSLQKKNGFPQSNNTARIQAIVDGRKADRPARTGPPGSARGMARIIQASPDKATELCIVDLEDTMHWVRAPHGKPSNADHDTTRDALVKRMHALESALSEDLKIHCELALMHVVHENLDKSYANDETMLGDSVKDIPRANFYVTEDNYAWDMDELVQAITANGGVMRNPLSRQMFTPKDVRGILVHPQGKSLAALQVQQHEMSKGVRLDTIGHMEKLAKTLLEDQSSDQLTSRHVIDEFLAYIATLPALEQKAIDGLRCPAKDSHTGQSYDFSIGEAVRDAKGNRVCFHKTGDFIKQAAAHLRQNRGAPPPDPDKCSVM
ncbi:hypothetical protein K458DRAFT_384766 [Lentithecium fluviatile CBS 122367]|uniref:Uncharacterized protein n=1 Tax=Lentithecium fluviatile CBS 122367 TaxID=1168545 RepID=A0A6G1JDE4_9PLEO|nr:hypothetical protein K458DRAFT_384766 [Lentithecium fluviatile CBS 122367]